MRKPLLVFTVVSLAALLVIPIVLVTMQKAGVKSKAGFREVRVLMPDGKVEKLELENYLVGVVSAEMPAEFSAEALKAQAIAARTYVVRKLVQTGQTDQGYDVDTTEKTQAWNSDQAMRSKWGLFRYLAYKRKISSAVKQTKGLVLTYGGDYVQAFYFSSAGRLPTERAEEVWGAALPYLTNVRPEVEEKGKFVSTVSFTPKELDAKLGTTLAKKSRTSQQDLKVLERTSAGRVKTLKIGGKVMEGTTVRTALNLRSTDFTLGVENNKLVLTTYGNGHAVGMSQYGANSLAKQGKNFQEILLHYYPGSELTNLDKRND